MMLITIPVITTMGSLISNSVTQLTWFILKMKTNKNIIINPGINNIEDILKFEKIASIAVI